MSTDSLLRVYIWVYGDGDNRSSNAAKRTSKAVICACCTWICASDMPVVQPNGGTAKIPFRAHRFWFRARGVAHAIAGVQLSPSTIGIGKQLGNQAT